MKIACKYVAFPVLLLIVLLAQQASAGSLGDKIAAELCYGSNTSYTLSTAELLEWNGQEISGEKVAYKGSDKYIATFYKAQNKNNNATCKKTSIVSGEKTCRQAGVTKSVNTLIKASWSAVTCP